MSEITQTITEYTGVIPNKATQVPAVFSAAADTEVEFMNGLPAEINTFGSQANSLRTEVNTSRTDAQTAQTAAELAETNAVAAQAAAESASTATLYDSGITGGHSVGDVVYSTAGLSYRCIQYQAEGAVQALTNAAYWTLISATLQQYKTIDIDAGAMVPVSTNGAEPGTNEYATNDINIDYFAFDATTLEKAQFKLTMPEDWDLGTVKAKLSWTSATGSTTADTVEWGVKAGALSDSDAIDAALGAGQVISDALLADNGTDIQITSATPAITVGGTPALGDVVVFEVYRNVSGTDSMVEDAWLFGLSIQYKTLTTAPAAW